MNSTGKRLSVGMLSLGCPKTLVDSELVLGQLEKTRYKMASHISNCDIAFLNTCAFIEDSKQESIDRILELLELKKRGDIRALVVLGCLFQRYPDKLAKEFKNVDAFIGTGDYAKIPDVVGKITEKLVTPSNVLWRGSVKRFEPFTEIGKPGFMYTANQHRVALTPKHFRYVKISEGCDHTCSFCTIPSFRGKHRSRPVQDVVDEVERLAREGAREIVLTGQDTTHYGRDFSGEFLLPELLRAISAIDKIEWVRILYAYPSFVTTKLMETIASEQKVCSYLDVPLQHISDDILLRMKRGINKARTVKLIKALRQHVPDIAIRTTFIIGFPGETDKHFEELLDFMRDSQFERLGIFRYSQEEETPAGVMGGQISEAVKEKRFEKAMLLQQEISKANNAKWIDKKLRIMIDGESEDEKELFFGRTYMDAPEVDGLVYIKAGKGKKWLPGDFVNVRVSGAQEYDLSAECLS